MYLCVCLDCEHKCEVDKCHVFKGHDHVNDYHNGCQCCGRTFLFGWYGPSDRLMMESDSFIYDQYGLRTVQLLSTSVVHLKYPDEYAKKISTWNNLK